MAVMKSRENKNAGKNLEAGEAAIIFLHNWKQKVRRYRIYKCFLLAALLVSCSVLVGVLFYQLDSSIPSVIHIRANEEEALSLRLPAKGEIVAVSEQGQSNIPRESITIDLSRTVIMKAGSSNQYLMDVKLFGFWPFKQVGIQVIQDEELIPVGVPVGIYVETEGVLVVSTGEFQGQDGQEYSPAKNILKSGDYILKLNGTEIAGKQDFIERIEQSMGREQTITLERNEKVLDVKVLPIKNQYGKYKLGAWVRDNAQGVGTMTYIDREGNFGALGHGINDVDTSALMEMDDGTLYQTEIIGIRKGTGGTPGEMTGLIVYDDKRILGDVTDNSVHGIFGVCNQRAYQLTTAEPLPIGLKQELTKGYAQILCTVDGSTRYYDIKITGVRLDNDNVNRGIELEVTDEELLEITGGIVQGMSGSPIIQDGKLIGAVTHVLVNDPTRGYGIFIENMLDAVE